MSVSIYCGPWVIQSNSKGKGWDVVRLGLSGSRTDIGMVGVTKRTASARARKLNKAETP